MKITEDAGKGIKEGAEGVSNIIKTGERNKWAFTLVIACALIAWLIYDNVSLREENNHFKDSVIEDLRKQNNDLKSINKFTDTSKSAGK